jgi:HK97 family phage prohead protease
MKTDTTLERRAFQDAQIRAEDSRKLKGYAIVFGSLSVDLGGFRELIAPEAVDRTLSAALDVRALVDHDSGKVIGRTRAGTLALRKDSKGLGVTIEPDPEISYAKDILLAVQRGDVSGMSFGFRVIEDSWNFEEQVPIRTVLDMRISEVSIVSFPAYEATNIDVAMRSLQAFQKEQGGSRLAWLQRWHKTRVA